MKVDVLAMGSQDTSTPQKFQAMSKEQFKAFQEATQKDAGLQEKLRSASSTDDVVAIARAAGFLISAEEL
jgi:predicted ribosomally synthesized peptide with nif11-like leader